MKKIALSQNQYALVDDADYRRVCIHKWYADRRRYTFYAVRRIRINGTWRTLSMHRFILGLIPGDGKETDHIDDNGLNNQQANLRICTTAENQHNRRNSRGASSQYKGVSWDKTNQRWRAVLKIRGKNSYLGSFKSETEAALAYNGAAREHYGGYARLNDVARGGEKNARE